MIATCLIISFALAAGAFIAWCAHRRCFYVRTDANGYWWVQYLRGEEDVPATAELRRSKMLVYRARVGSWESIGLDARKVKLREGDKVAVVEVSAARETIR